MTELLKVGAKNLAEIVQRLRSNDPTLKAIEFDPYQGPQDQWTDSAYQVRTLSTLVDAMAVNTAVKSFKLHSREVSGVAAGRVFGRLLAKNCGLQKLEIGCNDMGPAGAAEFAKGLAVNKGLLDFRSCFSKFGDEGMAYICAALEKNTTLRSINMGNEEIGDKGAKTFADMLKKNKSLLAFALPDNGISSNGVEALLGALLVNKTVEDANLSKISMRLTGGTGAKNDKAFERLMEVLRKNKTIVKLDLSYTMFSAQSISISAFGKALAENKRIADLRLECWALYPKATLEFGLGLKGNTQLSRFWGTDFHLFHDVEPKAALDAMAASLKNNPNFVDFWPGATSEPLKSLMERNLVNAQGLIAKIQAPKAKLTAVEAQHIRAGMNGIYQVAFNEEQKRLDEATKYSSEKFETIRKSAEAYAYNILALADAKIRAIGLGGLDIPKLYKPFEAEDALQQSFKAAGRKVDFSKLDARKAFSGSSKASSLATLAHKAATAGQVDELLDYVVGKGLRLGAKELLYRPDNESPALAEIIAAQGKLGRILTAENWREDAAGLEKFEQAMSPAIIAAQLPEGQTLDTIKWQMESSSIRKGMAPIRIGVRPK